MSNGHTDAELFGRALHQNITAFEIFSPDEFWLFYRGWFRSEPEDTAADEVMTECWFCHRSWVWRNNRTTHSENKPILLTAPHILTFLDVDGLQSILPSFICNKLRKTHVQVEARGLKSKAADFWKRLIPHPKVFKFELSDFWILGSCGVIHATDLRGSKMRKKHSYS